MPNRAICASLFAILISGCAGIAQLQGWAPALDHAADSKPGCIAKDLRDCQLIAAAYTGIGATEIAGGLLAGAGLGAAFGLGVASPLVAGAGAGLGAITSLMSSGDEYKQIFINCLRGRGHNPLN